MSMEGEGTNGPMTETPDEPLVSPEPLPAPPAPEAPAVEAVAEAPPAPIASPVPLAWQHPPILDVPGGTRAAFLHVVTVLLLGGLGLLTMVKLVSGSLAGMNEITQIACVLGGLGLGVQVLAAFPTILSARPAAKTLLFSAGIALAIAVLATAIVFPTSLRRGNGVLDLRPYPAFFCITATLSGVAFLGVALCARASLRCLLGLQRDGVERDENAESRALLAMLTAVGAAALVPATLLFLRLPLPASVPLFLFATLVGGLVARTQALAEGAVAGLSAFSPLRERLVPRVALASVALGAAAFSLSITVVMSIRSQLLEAIVDRQYGSGVGVGAATIDRALLVGPGVLTAIATASFWLPRLVLPRAADQEIGLPPPRGRRVALVLAVVSLGLMLRMEDVYERRVVSARDNLLVQEEKAKDD